MDLRKLKTLIDLVSESNVSELEITEPEGKVRIVKAMGAPMTPGSSQVMAYPVQAAQNYAPNQHIASDSIAPVATEPVAPVITLHTVKSPMVGTFYASSSQGGAPLVSVGDQVKESQAICIVEAMKIMNEIECDRAGRVVRVLATNGQAVEYGQALFEIE